MAGQALRKVLVLELANENPLGVQMGGRSSDRHSIFDTA